MNLIEDNVARIPETGCWLWLGNILRGYGRMPRTQHRAQRVSFELYRGPIARHGVSKATAFKYRPHRNGT